MIIHKSIGHFFFLPPAIAILAVRVFVEYSLWWGFGCNAQPALANNRRAMSHSRLDRPPYPVPRFSTRRATDLSIDFPGRASRVVDLGK